MKYLHLNVLMMVLTSALLEKFFGVVATAAASPAFVVLSSSTLNPSNKMKDQRSQALRAYTDDELGRSKQIKVVNSNNMKKSNVRKQDLPPSSLPNGGRITMVGSGPGDPDLLTMSAYKLLSDPSILVISDRLVSPEILELIQGEIKVARKLPGCAEEAQHEVC